MENNDFAPFDSGPDAHEMGVLKSRFTFKPELPSSSELIHVLFVLNELTGMGYNRTLDDVVQKIASYFIRSNDREIIKVKSATYDFVWPYANHVIQKGDYCTSQLTFTLRNGATIYANPTVLEPSRGESQTIETVSGGTRRSLDKPHDADSRSLIDFLGDRLPNKTALSEKTRDLRVRTEKGILIKKTPYIPIPFEIFFESVRTGGESPAVYRPVLNFLLDAKEYVSSVKDLSRVKQAIAEAYAQTFIGDFSDCYGDYSSLIRERPKMVEELSSCSKKVQKIEKRIRGLYDQKNTLQTARTDEQNFDDVAKFLKMHLTATLMF